MNEPLWSTSRSVLALENFGFKLQPPLNYTGQVVHGIRSDDDGAVIHNMLLAKAMSERLGLRYLGAFPWRNLDLIRLIGLPEPLLVLPTNVIYLDSWTQLCFRNKSHNATYFLPSQTIHEDFDVSREAIGILFNAAFRLTLRALAGLSVHVPAFSFNYLWPAWATLRVAVHVRRYRAGEPKEYYGISRYLPQQYFLEVIRQIQSLEPGAAFVIFTTASLGMSDDESDAEFLQMGAVVRSGESLIEAWVHLAQADICVLSRSAFSYVPGLLARGVVVYPTFWYSPLPHWVVTRGWDPVAYLFEPEFADELQIILRRPNFGAFEEQTSTVVASFGVCKDMWLTGCLTSRRPEAGDLILTNVHSEIDFLRERGSAASLQDTRHVHVQKVLRQMRTAGSFQEVWRIVCGFIGCPLRRTSRLKEWMLLSALLYQLRRATSQGHAWAILEQYVMKAMRDLNFTSAATCYEGWSYAGGLQLS